MKLEVEFADESARRLEAAGAARRSTTSPNAGRPGQPHVRLLPVAREPVADVHPRRQDAPRLAVPARPAGAAPRAGREARDTRLDGKDADPFVLPAGAVVREGPEAFVFVQNGDMFVARPVRVLYEDRNDVVIANDGSVTARGTWSWRIRPRRINRAIKAQRGSRRATATRTAASHDED